MEGMKEIPDPMEMHHKQTNKYISLKSKKRKTSF